jgi:hypothetical protein
MKLPPPPQYFIFFLKHPTNSYHGTAQVLAARVDYQGVSVANGLGFGSLIWVPDGMVSGLDFESRHIFPLI